MGELAGAQTLPLEPGEKAGRKATTMKLVDAKSGGGPPS